MVGLMYIRCKGLNKLECYADLLLNLDAVLLVYGRVGGLELLNADLLVSGRALLVRDILVDLLALLVICSRANVLVLSLVVCPVIRVAFLIVGGLADVLVDGVVNCLTLRAVGVAVGCVVGVGHAKDAETNQKL